MQLRCPKHDRVFETFTDHRSGGAEGMPVNGHTDCPVCMTEADSSDKYHHVNAAQSATDTANLQATAFAAKMTEVDQLLLKLRGAAGVPSPVLTSAPAARTVVA